MPDENQNPSQNPPSMSNKERGGKKDSEHSSLEATLSRFVEQLGAMSRTHVSASPNALSDFDVLSRSQAVADRRERDSKEASERRMAMAKALQDGSRKFLITLTDEPMMNRIVGADDQATAVSKYIRWFGIRSGVDDSRLRVDDVTEFETTQKQIKAQVLAMA